jgi:CDP-diacylglycerol--serine O-phosphatidyltransferase
VYGLSGYVVFVLQRARGKKVSLIPTDETIDETERR